MNVHCSSASDHTPFELIYGYTPDFMILPSQLVGMPHVNKRLQALEKAHKEAQAALRMSKDQMRSDLTMQLKKPYKFLVGDMVWLQSKNIKVHQQSQKLGPKQLGPFAVTEVLLDLDYRVTAYFDLLSYLYLSRLIHDMSLIIYELSVPPACLHHVYICTHACVNAYWTYPLSRYLAVNYLTSQRVFSHSTFLFRTHLPTLT